MEQPVAKCPNLNIESEGIKIPTILHSGSEVTLLHQPHLEEYLKHTISNLVPINQKHTLCSK